MTEVVRREPATLLKHQDLTREQVDLIKSTIAKGASDNELKLFLTVCNRTGLDPFTHQIWAIKRTTGSGPQAKTTLVHQIGIDGFRLTAQRSRAKGGPSYKGQTEPQWCDENGNWTEAGDIWMSSKPPFAAKVGVYVGGFVEPIYAIVEYRRVVQTKGDGSPNIFWSKGPAFQLAKCAEAAALRKAFPNELSGLYLEEEVGAGEADVFEITEPRSVQEARQALDPRADLPPPTMGTEDYEGLTPPVAPSGDAEAPTQPQEQHPLEEPEPPAVTHPTPPTEPVGQVLPDTEEPATPLLIRQVEQMLTKYKIERLTRPLDLSALEARLLLTKRNKAEVEKVVAAIEQSRPEPPL